MWAIIYFGVLVVLATVLFYEKAATDGWMIIILIFTQVIFISLSVFSEPELNESELSLTFNLTLGYHISYYTFLMVRWLTQKKVKKEKIEEKEKELTEAE